MCNFIIRPIKSYATVDINAVDEAGLIKRGDYLAVEFVEDGAVNGKLNGKTDIKIKMETFLHCFTANPDDIKKVREEEEKFMKPKSSKGEGKKSK